jgi:hypothetical protein
MIFDGQCRLYSTCRRCGQLMTVLNVDATTHPNCEPKPTQLESLTQGWMSTVKAGDVEAENLTAAEIATIEGQPPQLARSAHWYGAWGWPVFKLRQVGTKCTGGAKCKPLCQCPKTPATKNGFKDATTVLADIDQTWKSRPRANIGLATGHLFDVIDVDPRSGGVASFLDLLAHKRIPDVHGVVVTASGGFHLYIKPTGKGNSAGWMPGIDHRGVGGYVVAPPSTLGLLGRCWSWLIAPSPIIKAHT